ncbi:MAG TPA: alanine--tRNA ligase, partial [Bacteroidia bacterium]|nr:alanine--tRNA ligase [Bacteroidia bacterium]
TEVYKIEKDRLYVTVFEGDKKENLAFDEDAKKFWLNYVPEEKIIKGNKKDNFWEMGDTGPCGPCSEIHVDLRSDEDRKKITGKSLVNASHPQVIEIWNLVFMEFNRKADGSLEKLPAQHVDTGMGFERLSMVLQGKKSSYDTDVFQPLIKEIEKVSGKKYKVTDFSAEEEKINIAMRVIADHIRAISFTIADGQLPSNTGAGYVIRRILRRAVRYGYQSLGLKEPFLYNLVDVLVKQMGGFFPEIVKQEKLVKKVILEEEQAFVRTLEQGLKRIDSICQQVIQNNKKVIEGEQVFELYDTFGFPVDLTGLMAKSWDLKIDEKGFEEALEKQKTRSRAATTVDKEDWINVIDTQQSLFVGYEKIEEHSKIVRYRKIKAKGKDQYQVVLDKTPFYAESGGQVGDTGFLEFGTNRISVLDTQKENNLNVHFTETLPDDVKASFKAIVDPERRILTVDNHSATHLLHASLRKILGKHVEQRGSLVHPDHLRFDFSHFSKITDEELRDIEFLVNQKIRENIVCETQVMAIDDAKKLGAMALFGEKYGDSVRVVTIDKNFSIELCGGTHVKATGQIGYFKILTESAVSAGIRRIEAVTALRAQDYITGQIEVIRQASDALKNPKNLVKGILDLQQHAAELTKQVEKLSREQGKQLKGELLTKKQQIGNTVFVAEKVDILSADVAKDLCFQMKGEVPNLFLILGAEINGKANLFLAMSDELTKAKNWNASSLIREFSKEIQGGGGGQAFYATAGGTNIQGIGNALTKAKSWVEQNQ